MASPAATERPPSHVWTFPERGIAIAFPDGWDVTESEVFGFPWTLTTSGASAYCGVIDRSDAVALDAALPVESLDDWLAASLARWGGDLAARNVAGEVIDLPAGRVGRVSMDLLDIAKTWGDPDPDWASLGPSGRRAKYLFGDGERWYLLDRSARLPGAPGDDWRSIAETFEFLPEEG